MTVDAEPLRQFAAEGKTLIEAAEHFGVAYSSMPYWCRKYGVSFRGNYQPTKREKPKVVGEVDPDKKPKITEQMANLYKQVVEVRQHMRRLAHRERLLLDKITELTDEEAGDALQIDSSQ